MKRIKFSKLSLMAFITSFLTITQNVAGRHIPMYRFYRTTGSFMSTLKADLQYKSSMISGCVAYPDGVCSVYFSQFWVPIENEHPSPTAIRISIELGMYNGL
jgi:hypothetical protein